MPFLKRHVFRASHLALAIWLAAGAARADKMTDAEELFRRAKTLMAQKKDREACPLLEESQRLDPQMGTLLNLAICHETIGKIASAWGEYRAVEQLAHTANRADRVKLAHDRALKLEPRLPRLKVRVSSEAKVPGLVVKVDGDEKGEPLWSGLAVDPGAHVVEASAPGRKTATMNVNVNGEGAVASVTVPLLEAEAVESAKPVGPLDAESPSEDVYAANRSRRTTGFVVGGAGLAAAAAGGVFGVLAILGDGDAAKTCPRPCFAGSAEAKAADERTDRALVFANVANVVLPIGLVVAAIGGYMIFSAGPTEKASASAARRSILLSPARGGATLAVSF